MTTSTKELAKEELKAYNEILVKKYQDGDETAFNELLELNYGLIGYVLKDFDKRKTYFIEEDTKESLCLTGFFKAAKSHDTQQTAFSTYAIDCMRKEILKEIQYYNSKNRLEGFKKTSSIYKKIENKEGESELVDILPFFDIDKYFKTSFANIQPAVEYALSFTKPHMKDSMIPVAIGDVLVGEAAKDCGVSKQTFSYQFNQFKKRLKDYLEQNNLVEGLI